MTPRPITQVSGNTNPVFGFLKFHFESWSFCVVSAVGQSQLLRQVQSSELMASLFFIFYLQPAE
jgi:hypothetical protein